MDKEIARKFDSRRELGLSRLDFNSLTEAQIDQRFFEIINNSDISLSSGYHLSYVLPRSIRNRAKIERDSREFRKGVVVADSLIDSQEIEIAITSKPELVETIDRTFCEGYKQLFLVKNELSDEYRNFLFQTYFNWHVVGELLPFKIQEIDDLISTESDRSKLHFKFGALSLLYTKICKDPKSQRKGCDTGMFYDVEDL